MELAGLTERHFRPLHDRLASSVNFSNAATPIRRAWRERRRYGGGIESAVESALASPVVARRLPSAIFMALSIWLSPDGSERGFYRCDHPLGRDRMAAKRFDSSDDRRADRGMGESAAVRMQVCRGLRDSLRARRPPARRTVRLTPSHCRAGRGFSTTIDAVTSDLAIGSRRATTVIRPATIRARRPEVVDALP